MYMPLMWPELNEEPQNVSQGGGQNVSRLISFAKFSKMQNDNFCTFFNVNFFMTCVAIIIYYFLGVASVFFIIGNALKLSYL